MSQNTTPPPVYVKSHPRLNTEFPDGTGLPAMNGGVGRGDGRAGPVARRGREKSGFSDRRAGLRGGGTGTARPA